MAIYVACGHNLVTRDLRYFCSLDNSCDNLLYILRSFEFRYFIDVEIASISSFIESMKIERDFDIAASV